MKSPLDLLLPYQRDWVEDLSRFKVGLMARQTGKSFGTAGESVLDCQIHEAKKSKTTWVTLSAGERQALEWLRKAKEWCEAYDLALADVREERDSTEALLKSAEIEFPNGSRIIAIPANPNTARGYSANLTLDEFAFHEQPDAIWRAIYPSISNPLRGQYKIRIVSTPNGRGNKFADLCEKGVILKPGEVLPKGKWSLHKVDIHTAVARGLPLDIEELRAGLDDADGWAQEYECLFIDAASILLSYELLALAESPEASETIGADYWTTSTPFPLDLGIDFGRKKDLTVCWAGESVADLHITKEVLVLDRMSTPDQVEHLAPRIRKARRVCLDYTGPGIGLGDYLVKEFGEWKPQQDKFGKIELCTFTNSLKQEIFPKLRMSFEARKERIPVSRVIREDHHSMHRVVTPNGNVTYRAPHTEDGHADRCTAHALYVRAASYPSNDFGFEDFSEREDEVLERGEIGVGGRQIEL